MYHNEHFMHAYQITAVTLNAVLVDVRNYYLSVPFTIVFPVSCIILAEKCQNQFLASLPFLLSGVKTT